MSRPVAYVKLAEVAELNPRLGVALEDAARVSFLPMSAVTAETASTTLGEERAYGEVRKGYTPFLNGDVLVAKITPCFENGKIAQAILSRPVGFGSTEFHVVRPHAKDADARYLLHFLRQDQIRFDGERKMTGSGGQRRVPEHFLANLDVPVPSLPEQRRIAEVLDRVEALRAKRRAALVQLDFLTQSIFLEMFGDPATNPHHWRTATLGSLLAISPNFGTMIPPGVEGKWLSLRVANIQDWQLDLSDQKYLTLPQSSLERHSVRDGDLLMARAIASQDHLGKSIVVNTNGEQWAFDSHLMRLRFDPKLVKPEFVRNLLKSAGGRSLFLKASRRSAVQFNINTKEISALRIPVPPLALQQKFDDQRRAIETLKTAHRSALAELDALFASLQHRAFRSEL